MKISFWFLVATLFLLYGLIILAAGIYYWVANVSGPNTAYHVSVWWGLLLCLLSGVFFVVNRSKN